MLELVVLGDQYFTRRSLSQPTKSPTLITNYRRLQFWRNPSSFPRHGIIRPHDGLIFITAQTSQHSQQQQQQQQQHILDILILYFGTADDSDDVFLSALKRLIILIADWSENVNCN